MSQDGDDKRSKIGYWLKWIKTSQKAAKRHRQDTDCAYEEYEYSHTRSAGEDDSYDSKKGYPIYKFACDILDPAYYAQTPKVIARRRYGIEDNVALTMALIAERLGQFVVDNGHFDEAMQAAKLDFIHASKTTTQVIYATDTENYRIPLAKSLDLDDTYYTDDGELYEGEVQEEEGRYFGESKRAKEGTQRIYLAPVCYDEVLHTPEAKTNAEITEIAYKFCIPKSEAEELFNPDGKKSLPYKSRRDSKDGSSTLQDEDRVETSEKFLEGWECYCKHSKTRYWVCPDYPEDFLDKSPDDTQIRGFFPSPKFILSNRHRKSLYPTPIYVYLEGTISQLNVLYARIFTLIDSIRRRALVSGASQELINALNNLEGAEFIAIGDMTEILQKGGLENLIQWIPVQELVESLREALQLEEHFKNTFYEWFGVPDILRGQSHPEETAEAQGIKSDAAHDRFKYNKKLMTDLARDSAEMMLDLALEVFSAEKIAQICGYEFLESGRPAEPPSEQNPQGSPAKPGHKDRFFDALNRLKSDRDRLITIDFETDSTSFRDERRDMERQKLISQTAVQGLSMIGGIQNPEFAGIALKLLLSTLESMGGTSQTQDMIEQAVSDLEKARSMPAPPPPDYEGMKLELKGHELTLKAQQSEQKQAHAQAKTQLEAFQAQLTARSEEYKNSIKAFEAEARAAKAQSDIMVSQSTARHDQAMDKALLLIEQQRVELERLKAEVNAQESMMEEQRLAIETIQGLGSGSNGSGGGGGGSMAVPNINLSVEMPKPGSRKAKITRGDGTVTEIEVQDSEDLPVLPTEGL